MDAAEVLGPGAKILGRVLDHRPGRPEPGVGGRDPKALEREDSQRLSDRLGARGRREAVGGQFRAEPPRAEGVQGADGRLVVRGGLPAGEVALRDEDLGGIEPGEHREQVLDPAVARQLELPGGQIEPGGVQAEPVERERRQVLRARRLKLARCKRRARAQDPGDLALHELSGLGRLLLVAHRDLPARGEQLADIGVGRVIGNPRHRVLLALREREPEEPGGRHGVVEEHLVEIPEPEEQDRVARQRALHLEVLPHHRGELFGVGHGGQRRLHSRREARRKSSSAAASLRL